MTVAALLLWLCTAAVGSYLLLTGARSVTAGSGPGDEPARPAPVPAGQPAAASGAAQAPAEPARDQDPFGPPSLQRARSEPLPGLRDLAEFAHPALAITGVAFWVGYVVSRNHLFAVIGLGILLGAICAGLSWFTVNTRAARRAAAAGEAGDSGTGDPGTEAPGSAPMTFPPRLITLHAAGAVLTLLFAVLVAARV